MRGATVLVVDDDASLRDLVAQFLEGEGCRVLLATSGREALTHVAGPRPRPDLLLLDLLLPDIDGYAVLEYLQQHPEQDLPVLVFSAHRPAASLLQALDAERRDFIAGPTSRRGPRGTGPKTPTGLRRRMSPTRARCGPRTTRGHVPRAPGRA